MHLLTPKQTSTSCVQAAGKHSAKTGTHWCPRQSKQAWRQHFYSGHLLNMQMLEYPSLVTQKTKMTLYAPGFQDAFAFIAMV